MINAAATKSTRLSIRGVGGVDPVAPQLTRKRQNLRRSKNPPNRGAEHVIGTGRVS